MSFARAVTLRSVFILAVSFVAAKPGQAAGPWLYEGGTPDMGTATAGRQALAEVEAPVLKPGIDHSFS